MAHEHGIAVVDTSTIAVPHGFAEDIDLITRTFAKDLTVDELRLFVAIAHGMGLSITHRQIHAVKRKSRNGPDTVTFQVGIDGYRSIAEAHPDYAGQDGPYWCGDDGQWTDVWLDKQPPRAAKVGIFRTSFKQPLFAVALWDEYFQTNYQGDLTPLWKKMPALMLAKCFDQYTEVLTDRGFQRFASVTGRVLQVTDSGLEPTDAVPFSQDWAGDMVTLDSDDLNFSVTPNHDMVTTQGKIEAGALFDQARARAKHRIPRSVKGTSPGLAVSDDEIRLAAAYLADGADRPGLTFGVSVSRPRKIEMIRGLGLAMSEGVRHCAGDKAYTSVRTITTKTDKVKFTFAQRQVNFLCDTGKRIKADALLALSHHQARVLVDALIAFDGHTVKTSGVRRFYTSRIDHLEAFETAAVMAGYAVSNRKSRFSDIATKPNYSVTISDRDEIPVIRWGRDYNNLSKSNDRGRTGIHIERNSTGKVWCVTVPSGVIVVRRHGFSMLCGNCAEGLAIRKAFPAKLSGTYSDVEMGQAANISDIANAIDVTVRPNRAITVDRDNVGAITANGEGVGQGTSNAGERVNEPTSMGPSRDNVNAALHAWGAHYGLTHSDIHNAAVQLFSSRNIISLTDLSIADLTNMMDKLKSKDQVNHQRLMEWFVDIAPPEEESEPIEAEGRLPGVDEDTGEVIDTEALAAFHRR